MEAPSSLPGVQPMIWGFGRPVGSCGRSINGDLTIRTHLSYDERRWGTLTGGFGAVNRLEAEDHMMKFSAIFCAQLAMSAVVISMSGAASAQDQGRAEATVGFTRISDIGCVDGMPAPPYTQICPTTPRVSAALATMPRSKAHAKRKTIIQ
jgi:hypothetical protein